MCRHSTKRKPIALSLRERTRKILRNIVCMYLSRLRRPQKSNCLLDIADKYFLQRLLLWNMFLEHMRCMNLLWLEKHRFLGYKVYMQNCLQAMTKSQRNNVYMLQMTWT